MKLRPPQKLDNRRRHVFQVRVNAKELRLIDEKCERYGVTRAALVRYMTICREPDPAHLAEEKEAG